MEPRGIVVSKFGGTSMSDATAMDRSAAISHRQGARMVVVSATSGTTNQLLQIVASGEKGNLAEALAMVEAIKARHLTIAKDIELEEKEHTQLQQLFDELATLAHGMALLREASLKARDRIQAVGERMSSLLFAHVMQKTARDKKVILQDARAVLRTDSDFGKATPLIGEIKSLCSQILTEINNPNVIYVTQGFIGQTEDGETTTLGRGGSDYSAALLAEGVGAQILEIWTDVAGIASTDPRICPNAKLMSEVTFKEASEMAIFGAKILHPTTLTPAMRSKIGVYVASSFEPHLPGTWIKWKTDSAPLVRAITIKKNQGLITLSTPKMLNAYGHLFEIFKVFNQHKVAVDAITTSEISVAITVDAYVLEKRQLIADLKELCDVKIENDLALVSLIGNNINHTPGLAKEIFAGLENINVRMTCQGASVHNFCFLVEGDKGDEALKRLHLHFLENKI